jgi:hypothetical protein
MTRAAIFFTFGAAVAAMVVLGVEHSIVRAPEHGLIVCHADGTTFVGHIDVRGISQADLSNAVQMMCRFRERMGV